MKIKGIGNNIDDGICDRCQQFIPHQFSFKIASVGIIQSICHDCVADSQDDDNED